MNSFWRGFLSVFDLSGTLLRRDHSPPRFARTDEEAFEQDRKALQADWDRACDTMLDGESSQTLTSLLEDPPEPTEDLRRILRRRS